MVTTTYPENDPDSYVNGIGLETNPDIVAWLKANTPSYRVLYNDVGFYKQVWFTSADDYILFKLTFDIA